jgi:cell shape-determining protein MreC
MLNWRRDPGYEQRMRETEIAILRERQKRLQIEQQIEQMKKEDELLEKEDEQIENEIEQLRRENARLKTLLACVDQICFLPVSSSSPPKSTKTDCGPSSP